MLGLLPVETWLTIMEYAYVAKIHPSILPNGSSTLPQRAKLHQRLSLVSHAWHDLSTVIFFQDVDVYTPRNLDGLKKAARDHPLVVANAV